MGSALSFPCLGSAPTLFSYTTNYKWAKNKTTVSITVTEKENKYNKNRATSPFAHSGSSSLRRREACARPGSGRTSLGFIAQEPGESRSVQSLCLRGLRGNPHTL